MRQPPYRQQQPMNGYALNITYPYRERQTSGDFQTSQLKTVKGTTPYYERTFWKQKYSACP